MTKTLHYALKDLSFAGQLALPSGVGTPGPGLLIAPTWAGCNAFAIDQAERFAALGYAAMVLDPYGHGRVGETPDQCAALMEPLIKDRSHLQQRLEAARAALAAQPEVDPESVVAIGYCFGGLCVLDLARQGAPLAGVISLHGLFTPMEGRQRQGESPLKALVLHGFEDPMATPEEALALGKELTALGIDWQLHFFGATQHAFTNPEARNPEFGTVYSSSASERAHRLIRDFLDEVLN